jgi:small nuclear ribonucleoprotein G
VQLNGSRKVMGILRGYDVRLYLSPPGEIAIRWLVQVYLNIVLDEALEEKPGGEKVRIGMVVIRGNAVVMLEVWESIDLCTRWEVDADSDPGPRPH